MTKTQQREQQEAIEHLREMLKPGDTVFTTVRHVSPSGMTRWIDAYVIRDDEPVWISYFVAKAIGSPVNTRNHEGVEMGGCGMDMGFALVYSLSQRLFPDGFDCIDQDRTEYYSYACPSNDHSNCRQSRGDVVPTHHSSGGYALKQRWL